jgi:hypothetical protein
LVLGVNRRTPTGTGRGEDQYDDMVVSGFGGSQQRRRRGGAHRRHVGLTQVERKKMGTSTPDGWVPLVGDHTETACSLGSGWSG